MEVFGAFLSGVMGVLTRPLEIFGYSFSMWNLFLFSLAMGALSRLVWGFFQDG